MRSDESIGRAVGVLLLAHFAAALITPFVMLDRVRGAAGLFANAAASPGLVHAAVLLLFFGSAVAVGVAATALPVFHRYSPAAAIGLVALAASAFALQATDGALLLTLLSLSQEHARAGTTGGGSLQEMGLVVGFARRWAHYSYLLAVGGWTFLLFGLVYRFRLVPRALAAFGLVACVLQVAGVPLRGLLGYPPETRLAIPLAPAYVGLAVWLMVKGFSSPLTTAPAAAPSTPRR